MEEQEVKVVLRSIGHQFLLEMGDSQSRVLPVEKVVNRYVVRFEREFVFEAGVLADIVLKTVRQPDVALECFVEVQKCDSPQIMHSFKVHANSREDMLACQHRLHPPACYEFYFTPIVTTQPVEPSTDKPEKTGSAVPWMLLFACIGVVGVFLIWKYRPASNKEYLIRLGNYVFDTKNMTIAIDGNEEELSSKEADLLVMLYEHEGQTLTREEILNTVWNDRNQYEGRTLDVFISKLRKRLELDTRIKIINIRGVGYKLVVNA